MTFPTGLSFITNNLASIALPSPQGCMESLRERIIESLPSPKEWMSYAKNRITNYVLSGRIIVNWQESLMIAGIATSIIGIAVTFFAGMPVIFSCSILLLAISATGIYCVRKSQGVENNLHATQGRFTEINNGLQRQNQSLEATNHRLNETVTALQTTGEQYRQTAADLEATNRNLQQSYEALQQTSEQYRQTVADLEASNRNLQQSNEALQNTSAQYRQTAANLEATNQNLQQTCRDFEATQDETRQLQIDLENSNQILQHQVSDLTLQVTQLSESAVRIRDELVYFQSENSHLTSNNRNFNTCLARLNEEIETSKALCTQIEQHLHQQQWNFGEQIGNLRQLIIELKTDGGTLEKLRFLMQLNDQIRGSSESLREVQIQYAIERANFEAIRNDFIRVQEELARLNQELQGSVDRIHEETEEHRQSFAQLQREFAHMTQNLADNAERVREEREVICTAFLQLQEALTHSQQNMQNTAEEEGRERGSICDERERLRTLICRVFAFLRTEPNEAMRLLSPAIEVH